MMNTNELIDYWRDHRHSVTMAKETESMLRQLQAENEQLKLKIQELYEEPGSYWFKEPDGV